MSFTALRAAARHRLARMRGVPTREDSGFALVFVLLVTTIIMMGVSSMMMVAASNIGPASHSEDTQAASAAAESGIQSYVAYLNDQCTTFDGSLCTAISGDPSPATRVPGADGNGTETYTTTVLNPTSYLADGFLRVKSTGSYGTGTRTLVADLSSQPNVLRYAYLSKYETLGASFLKAYYPARSIRIADPTAEAAAGLSGAKTVTWNAPATSGTGDVGICDQLWYSSPGRASAKASYDATLPVGTDWSATGSDATMYQPCEVTFSSGMSFNGPVYSDDALYLSYGTPSGAGPTFTVPTGETLPAASTGASSSDPGLATGYLYRSFPYLGGGPSMSSSNWPNTVQHSDNNLVLPSNADDARAKATCVYSGPTRITLSGTTAVITSPMTQADASNPCYASSTDSSLQAQQVPVTNTTTLPGGTTKTNVAGTASVLQASVSVDNTLVYVQNAGAGSSWPSATSAAPIFDVGSGTAPALPSTPPTASLSYSPTTLTSSAAFNKEASSGPNWTSYSGTATGQSFQTWLNNVVSGAPTTDIVSTISNAVKQFDSTNGGNPNGSNDYRYRVSSTSPTTSTTTSTTTSAVPSTVTDPFLSNTAGNVKVLKTTTTTTTKATVYRQPSVCNLLNLLGLCVGSWVWSGSTSNQFTVTDTQTSVSYSQTFTPASSTFPIAGDITQYPTWSATGSAPGDVYIEGTGYGNRLSLVAQHDIVVTGKLTTSGSDGSNARGESAWKSGGAIGLVADDNVRIYHPLSCAATPDANTSAGYCPNDITGLYNESNPPATVITSSGTFGAAHPAMQYCNMTTGSDSSNCSGVTSTGSGPVTEVDAAVFALTGSLMTDNYDRGEPMGDTTVTGGVYQLHRGATGQQWEIQADGTSRLTSGYVLQDDYLDLQPASLAYIPQLQFGNGNAAWSVVSVSSAPAGATP